MMFWKPLNWSMKWCMLPDLGPLNLRETFFSPIVVASMLTIWLWLVKNGLTPAEWNHILVTAVSPWDWDGIPQWCLHMAVVNTQLAKVMGPTWGPSGSCRPQMGPMNLAIRVDIIPYRRYVRKCLAALAAGKVSIIIELLHETSKEITMYKVKECRTVCISLPHTSFKVEFKCCKLAQMRQM